MPLDEREQHTAVGAFVTEAVNGRATVLEASARQRNAELWVVLSTATTASRRTARRRRQRRTGRPTCRVCCRRTAPPSSPSTWTTPMRTISTPESDSRGSTAAARVGAAEAHAGTAPPRPCGAGSRGGR